MLDSSPRFKMIELDETTSTNTFLATYRPPTTKDITLVTAEYQSGGRGQAGNSWESERGQNLLFSLLLHPTFLPATHLFALSELIALSIRDAVAQVLTAPSSFLPAPASSIPASVGDHSVTVKWPNDVYVGDKKIAGILIENTLRGPFVDRCIIGCGVNVNQQRFLSDAPNPVSLRQLVGCDLERSFVLEYIIDAFARRYDAITASLHRSPLTASLHSLPLTAHPSTLAPAPSVHSDYLAALYRRTGLHSYRDASGPFRAEIADVEPTGHLVLRDEAGHLRRYAFKEVEYLIDT